MFRMNVCLCTGLACMAALACVLAGCEKKEAAQQNTPAAAAAQLAAEPMDPATAGSIRGSVRLDGPIPQPRSLNMTTDPACTAAHPAGIASQEVVADWSGNLANVVVYVKEGLGNRAFAAPKTPVEIIQEGCLYSPHVVALMTGQALIVRNADKTLHNVHSAAKNNREWNRSQAPGAPDIEEVFAREELAIAMKCNVHPWMKSYVAVFAHPYFAVSGADGSFEIKNLPAGTYTVEAWHEKYGTLRQTVTLGAKEVKSLAFTFQPATGGN